MKVNSDEMISAIDKAWQSPEEKSVKMRSYKEGVFYAKILLALVGIIGLCATYSCISYSIKPQGKYYMTNYQGDIRMLSPSKVERR